jgi:Zn finger protein HypA/HybF involved in hydrogenase expression
MTAIPSVWCPECGAEIRPAQVLEGRCPTCKAELVQVVVDPETYHAIRRGTT